MALICLLCSTPPFSPPKIETHLPFLAAPFLLVVGDGFLPVPTSFVALVLASFLAGLAFNSGFGFAAVLGAVIGASLAVGGFALLAAHALVGAGGIHGAVVLALFDGGALFGGGLFSFLVAAGNHGKHGHGGHSGKQNFLHCVLMFFYWFIK